MKPNDETIYNGTEVGNEENPQVVNDGKKKNAWKLIGLGGVTGILMGAGTIYAANAMAAEGGEVPVEDENVGEVSSNDGTSEVKVANVTPGKSFSQAFAEARAEVGPGGVFHWHGGIYNTYTKEEWDAMSAEEKQEFAENVRPEYGVDKIDTASINETQPQVHVVPNSDEDIADAQTVNVSIDEVHIHANGNDDDVHIIGYQGSVDASLNGQDATVHIGQIDNHDALIIDYNDDDTHDIGIVDVNDNALLDDGEAIDLTTGEILDADLNPMQTSIDNTDMGSDSTFGV